MASREINRLCNHVLLCQRGCQPQTILHRFEVAPSAIERLLEVMFHSSRCAQFPCPCRSVNAMILLDEVVEIFTLPQFTSVRHTPLRFELLKSLWISRVFIN